MSSTDRYVWKFDALVWRNMRRRIRSFGTGSVWYRALRALLMILSDRATMLSWIRRQRRIEDADIEGLREFGIRYGVRQIVGEDPEDYRQRLLQNQTLRRAPASLTTKRQRVAYALGSEDFSIVSVYKHEDGQPYRIGDELSGATVGRSYTIWRYYILIARAITLQEKTALFDAITPVNFGGTVPEIRTDEGEIDWFQIGGDMTAGVASRRSEQSRRVSRF